MEPVKAEEAYFDFALMAVKRATELAGSGVRTGQVAYSIEGRASWFGKADSPRELVEVAARALLLAIGPKVIETDSRPADYDQSLDNPGSRG